MSTEQVTQSGWRSWRSIALVGVAWSMLVAVAAAGPMESYVAATDTTHNHWNELALASVSSITGPGDGHLWMTDTNGDDPGPAHTKL